MTSSISGQFPLREALRRFRVAEFVRAFRAYPTPSTARHNERRLSPFLHLCARRRVAESSPQRRDVSLVLLDAPEKPKHPLIGSSYRMGFHAVSLANVSLLFFATRPCYCGLLGREGTAHVSALLSIIDIPRLVVLFAAKDIITTYRIDNQFSHVRPPMLSPIE